VEGNKSVNTPEIQTKETHQSQTVEEGVKTDKIKEARENSKGDLPSPLREVASEEEENKDDDTDEIFFTAPEEPDPEEITEKDERREGTVHTEEPSDTREYSPGDLSQSPQREVLSEMSPP
jgi:hypothetical protein